jgi:glycosyltransferase involved in cell wall biosynthesis
VFLKTNRPFEQAVLTARRPKEPTIAVIWVDWSDYHVARFRAVNRSGRSIGIELIGGAGRNPDFPWRADARSGLPITTLLPKLGWREAGQRRIAVALWKALSRSSPDVLLIPGYYHAGGITAAVWGRLRRKTNILMSESTYEDHVRVPIREFLKRCLIRCLFDYTIVGGKRTRDYMRTLGMADARLGLFHNVVDNNFFCSGALNIRAQRTASELGLPAQYFLFAGRLAPEKNIEGLLEAFASYQHRGGSWSLVIVGDGPLRADLQVRAAPFANVHFAGFQRAADLVSYYAFAGCFVLPSIREPWGLVVNEAMAAGLPIIVSSRCGCADDLIEQGGNGFVFDAADSAALANYMYRVSTLSQEERDRMGQRSLDIISRYSPESFASEVWRIARNSAVPA